jgi:hypothetical protein
MKRSLKPAAMQITSDATIHVSQLLGAVLTGRPMAAKIMDLVDETMAKGDTPTLDFSGVRAVSPSFADELFGKLSVRDATRAVHFTNLSEHLQSVARMAERQRRLSDAS